MNHNKESVVSIFLLVVVAVTYAGGLEYKQFHDSRLWFWEIAWLVGIGTGWMMYKILHNKEKQYKDRRRKRGSRERRMTVLG